jgi:hypothetical protein
MTSTIVINEHHARWHRLLDFIWHVTAICKQYFYRAERRNGFTSREETTDARWFPINDSIQPGTRVVFASRWVFSVDLAA